MARNRVTVGRSQVTAHTAEYDCNADAYAYPVIKSYPEFQNCGYPTINMMIKENKEKENRICQTVSCAHIPDFTFMGNQEGNHELC